MRTFITLLSGLLLGCPTAGLPAAGAGPPDARPHLVLQTGPDEAVSSVAFSPDGSLLATGSSDGRVRVYDRRTGALQRAIGTDPCRGLRAIAFSPDGKSLACAGAEMDKTVKIWDPRTGTLLRTLAGHEAADPGNLYAEVYALAFSPDGKLVASAGRDKLVLVWDLETGKPCRRLAGHEDAVGSLAFSPDGKTLAGGGADKAVRLWDPATGRLRATLRGHLDRVNALSFSPDGKTLASASSAWSRNRGRTPRATPDKCEVRLQDAATGEVVWRVAGQGRVSSLAFSPDGAKVACGVGEAVRLYDARTGRADGVVFTHDGEVSAVAFAPDGQAVLSGSLDHTVALTALPKRAPVFRLTGSWEQVNAVAVSADGTLIASGSSDLRFAAGKRPASDRVLGPGGVRLWDAKAGRLLRALGDRKEQVASVAVSPDSRWVAAAGGGRDGVGVVRLWDARTGSEVWRQPGHRTAALAVAFSPDGRSLASGGADGTVQLRDARTGAVRRSLEGHAGAVTSVAFSADGSTLASGGADRSVRLWDPRTGRPGRTLRADSFRLGTAPRMDEAPRTVVALSPDGGTVAACCTSPGFGDRQVKLWDAQTGRLKRALERPQSAGRVVAFSPDGSTLASSGTGKAIAVWDVQTGKLVRELPGHPHPPLSVAFAPDGRTLVSGGGYRTMKLWDVGSGKLRGTLTTFSAGPDGDAADDWAAFTPDGYYDGSPRADRILAWYADKGLRTAERLKLRRPDLLEESIRGR
jgi:WD40 repeat protein